jgi:signal transduction histidine kinase
MSIIAAMMDVNRTDDAGGKEVRLSTRLSLMHLVVSAVLIASIVIGTLLLAKEHDRQASNYMQQMIDAKASSFERRMRATNRDYSVWTEAYEAILNHDVPWLYSNIGTGAAEIGALDLIVLVPPGGAQPFGWRLESPESGETDLLPPALIEELLALLDGTAAADRPVKSAYAILDGEVWLLTVTRVIPVDGLPGDVSDADAPRQIQGVRIGQNLVKDIKDSFILQEVSIAEAPAPGQSSHPLQLINSDETAEVVWTAPMPGTQILVRAALPLALVILAFSTVAVLISRYSTRAARRLETALLEAKAADRAKSQFLGIVSHELRTPMNGIIGLGQLLQAEEMGERHRTLLSTMMSCAKSQMRLIEALLDIAQIESGKRALAVGAFNPSGVLSEIAEVARVSCEQKGLSFELQDETDRSARVIGDQEALRQIVTNLVENAIKFTQSGGVMIRASATPRGTSALDYRISVEDSGIGVDPSNHARIFQHLTQVDSSTTRVAGGLGLGLSICRWLSEMMGGEILVDSALGAGSTFTFVVTLPVAEGAVALKAA